MLYIFSKAILYQLCLCNGEWPSMSFITSLMFVHNVGNLWFMAFFKQFRMKVWKTLTTVWTTLWMANGSQYYERHRTALHKPDGLLVTYPICNTYQNKYVKTELESHSWCMTEQFITHEMRQIMGVQIIHSSSLNWIRHFRGYCRSQIYCLNTQ